MVGSEKAFYAVTLYGVNPVSLVAAAQLRADSVTDFLRKTLAMADQIRSVFEQQLTDLKIDQSLMRQIQLYQTGFVNKTPEHSEFFGGNLTGVHVVRFTDQDKLKWFDIIQADEDRLQDEINKIPAVRSKSTDEVFKVGGNAFNLSCAYLLHKLHNAGKLPYAERKEAMINVLLILQFKFITGRLYQHFRFPADRAVAEATYMELTNKFHIKAKGSWLAVLRDRAEDVLSPTSIHQKAIEKMNDDDSVVRMVADIQSRIRDMLKNIYNVFQQVHASGVRVRTTSSIVEYDGMEALKDRTRGVDNYTRYIKSVVSDYNSFVREELLDIVQSISPSASEKRLLMTLKYISENHLKTTSGPNIDQLLSDVMIHSFGYLYENRSNIRGNIDLAGLLTRLKNLYTASRSSDPMLLKLRADMEIVVIKAIDTNSKNVVAGVRTAALLYIVARAYTMRHYTSGA